MEQALPTVIPIAVVITAEEKTAFLEALPASGAQWIEELAQKFPFLAQYSQDLALPKFIETLQEPPTQESKLDFAQSFFLWLVHTKKIAPRYHHQNSPAMPLNAAQIEALRTGLTHPTITLDPLTASILNDVVAAKPPTLLSRQIIALKPWRERLLQEWFLSTVEAKQPDQTKKAYNKMIRKEMEEGLAYSGDDPELLKNKAILSLFFWNGYDDRLLSKALNCIKKTIPKSNTYIKSTKKDITEIRKKYWQDIIKQALENIQEFDQQNPITIEVLLEKICELWDEHPIRIFAKKPKDQKTLKRLLKKLPEEFAEFSAKAIDYKHHDKSVVAPPALPSPDQKPDKVTITLSVERVEFTQEFYEMSKQELKQKLLAHGVTAEQLRSITPTKKRKGLKKRVTPLEKGPLIAFWRMAFPDQENTAENLLTQLTDTQVISESPEGLTPIARKASLRKAETRLFYTIAALTKPGCFSKPDIVKLFLGEEATEDASTALINFLTEQQWIAPVTLEKKVMAQAQPAANASGEFGSLSWVVVPDGKATFGGNPLGGEPKATTAEPAPHPYSLTLER